MNTRLDYETASYGTGQNVDRYSVSVQTLSNGTVRMVISPASPADGRGVGPGRGSVTRMETTIPCDVAHQLAAILNLAAEMAPGHFEATFKVDESLKSLVLQKSA